MDIYMVYYSKVMTNFIRMKYVLTETYELRYYVEIKTTVYDN